MFALDTKHHLIFFFWKIVQYIDKFKLNSKQHHMKIEIYKLQKLNVKHSNDNTFNVQKITSMNVHTT